MISKAKRARGDEETRSRTWAFAIVLAAGFMALLDVSIVNVALPSIETGLNAGPAEVQWIVAGYALTFGLTLVAAGKAGDIFGRRRLFMIGVLGFVLASAGCGFANSPELLIVMRLLQGLFAGVLNPQVLGLIQDLFAGPARARAFGFFGVIVGISTAIGPTLGGLLIALAGPEFGWRLVFLINLPIGLIILPLAAKYLPRTPAGAKRNGSWGRQFDLVGVLLVGLTVVLIMYPFLQSSGEAGDGSVGLGVFWLLGFAVLSTTLTYLWERWQYSKGRQVLLDPTLIHDPSFMLGVATGFFYFAGFTSIFIIVTLYLQQGLGWSPLHSGLAVVPFALVSGLSSGISGRLVNSFGRLVPVAGAALFTVSMVGAAAVGFWSSPPLQPFLVLAAMTIGGIGSGLLISPNQALTLEAVPGRLAGTAAALLQTFQRLGTAIGLSVVTTVFFHAEELPQSQKNPGLPVAISVLLVAGLVFLAFISTFVDWRRRRSEGALVVRHMLNHPGGNGSEDSETKPVHGSLKGGEKRPKSKGQQPGLGREASGNNGGVADIGTAEETEGERS